MKSTTNLPVSVKLDSDMRNRIEKIAATRGRSAHWIMREAIHRYVEQEDKREAFRQATLKAWEEFQFTGLHANEEEVDAWLASWGTDDEMPVPECHK